MPDAESEPCNCTALRQGSRHVTRFYDEVLAPVGLGVNQYAILARLERSGPTSLHALARRLVMDRSTLGHLLRPLERRAWVTLAVSDTDRRSRTLALTVDGRAVLAVARPLWSQAQARFEAIFGNNSAAQLRSMLKRVATTEFRRPTGSLPIEDVSHA